MTMTDHRSKTRVKKTRIALTDRDLRHFSATILSQSVPELVKRTGLSYMLIYNIIHGRVKSISDRHYRILFGEAPPVRKAIKVDGSMFRTMVDLWLLLNDDVTKSDLYREFYANKQTRRVDYRIFTGQIKMVEPGLERMMQRKFSDAGIDQQTLERWMDEMTATGPDDRVPYGQIRPILVFLQNELGVHPTRILNQSFGRYESGMLKSVSRTIYDNAVKLQKRSEKVLETRSRLEIEKVKEDIYGGKSNYTLYAEVDEELHFLCKHAMKSAKRYLGRGTSIYEIKGAKRIASWRAAKIFDDCDNFIRQTPELSLSVLPRSRQKMFIRRLLAVLVARTARMLTDREGIIFEKEILRPLHPRDEYKKPTHGFTQFDRVSGALGMRKKAFDLMVAKNCEMFREVGRYDKRWYLSDLYLKELSEKAFFEFVTAKYEMIAKEINHLHKVNECMH
jgi:Mor family transcriptional regulator